MRKICTDVLIEKTAEAAAVADTVSKTSGYLKLPFVKVPAILFERRGEYAQI